MNPLILLPISACILTSCSLSEFQSKTPSTIQAPSSSAIVQNQKTEASTAVTDPTLIASILRDAYAEERLAEAIYTKIVAKYPEFSEITNIVNSEESHSVQVGRLLDARGISRPTDYGSYSGAYEILSKMVDTSRSQAIEAGVMIEVGDIDHLIEEYRKIEDTDVRKVFENIGGGSFNHLRAFLRLASQNNFSITTDYARYMTADEIDSAGSLKSKMVDLLKANNLPTFGTQGGRNGGQGDRSGPTGSETRRGGAQDQGSGMGRMNQ